MNTYIMIENTAFAVDTEEQIAAAREALSEAGLTEAVVFAGDPECPDSYATSNKLFA